VPLVGRRHELPGIEKLTKVLGGVILAAWVGAGIARRAGGAGAAEDVRGRAGVAQAAAARSALNELRPGQAAATIQRELAGSRKKEGRVPPGLTTNENVGFKKILKRISSARN
jgi:hypothetical protein